MMSSSLLPGNNSNSNGDSNRNDRTVDNNINNRNPNLRRIPCKARGLPQSHNATTAIIEIPSNASHGMILACSFPECRASGRRFRYCQVCAFPVAKRNFQRRHGHGISRSSEPTKEDCIPQQVEDFTEGNNLQDQENGNANVNVNVNVNGLMSPIMQRSNHDRLFPSRHSPSSSSSGHDDEKRSVWEPLDMKQSSDGRTTNIGRTAAISTTTTSQHHPHDFALEPAPPPPPPPPNASSTDSHHPFGLNVPTVEADDNKSTSSVLLSSLESELIQLVRSRPLDSNLEHTWMERFLQHLESIPSNRTQQSQYVPQQQHRATAQPRSSSSRQYTSTSTTNTNNPARANTTIIHTHPAYYEQAYHSRHSLTNDYDNERKRPATAISTIERSVPASMYSTLQPQGNHERSVHAYPPAAAPPPPPPSQFNFPPRQHEQQRYHHDDITDPFSSSSPAPYYPAHVDPHSQNRRHHPQQQHHHHQQQQQQPQRQYYQDVNNGRAYTHHATTAASSRSLPVHEPPPLPPPTNHRGSRHNDAIKSKTANTNQPHMHSRHGPQYNNDMSEQNPSSSTTTTTTRTLRDDTHVPSTTTPNSTTPNSSNTSTHDVIAEYFDPQNHDGNDTNTTNESTAYPEQEQQEQGKHDMTNELMLDTAEVEPNRSERNSSSSGVSSSSSGVNEDVFQALFDQ